MKKKILTHCIKAFSFTLMVLAFSGVFTEKVLAQNYRIELSLEKDSILIGEQTTLRISYELPTNIDFAPLPFKDTITKSIEVIAQSDFDTITPDDVSRTVYEQSLIITSFDTGFQVIPPLKMQWAEDSVVSQPLLLYVGSVSLGEEPQLIDIKNPLEVNFSLIEWLNDYWPWLVGLLILLILSYLIWWYLKKRKETEKIVTVKEERLPSDVIALEALNKLEKQALWQKGELKIYYSEISEILRTFIEARFQINALEQTTDEILRNLKYTEINDKSKSILREILSLSDFVKFAKAKPESADSELSMKNAKEFVILNKELSAKEFNSDDKSEEKV